MTQFCCTCSRPELALSGGWEMSAVRLLLAVQQTSIYDVTLLHIPYKESPRTTRQSWKPSLWSVATVICF
jgi:hypothetical protein